MPVPLLQLRPRAQVPSGAVQELPRGDDPGLRQRPALRPGEVLGLHAVLQARGRAPRHAKAQDAPGAIQDDRGLQGSLLGKDLKKDCFPDFVNDKLFISG